MKKIFFLIAILIQSFTTFSQTLEVRPDLNTEDIFTNVTFLQESPNFHDKLIGVDYAFRFIITTSEIYDQIYIEKVTYGSEGGSKQVKWRKKMNMDAFYELGVTGEIFNVKFNNWTDEESFNLTIHDIEYEVSSLNSEKWKIKRKN